MHCYHRSEKLNYMYLFLNYKQAILCFWKAKKHCIRMKLSCFYQIVIFHNDALSFTCKELFMEKSKESMHFVIFSPIVVLCYEQFNMWLTQMYYSFFYLFFQPTSKFGQLLLLLYKSQNMKQIILVVLIQLFRLVGSQKKYKVS